jgi:hypothetical protein
MVRMKKAVRARRSKVAAKKPSRRGGGRRAKGEDLASKIGLVLKGSMSIPQIVAAVKKAGYKSSSPSFARIVGMPARRVCQALTPSFGDCAKRLDASPRRQAQAWFATPAATRAFLLMASAVNGQRC